MRLLGIDFGEKRIGIAVSDEEGLLAFPKEVILNENSAVSKIATLVLENGIKKIVFGLSQNSEGVENKIMEIAKKFAEELKTITAKEVVFQNEAFSSFHAHNEKFAVTEQNTNKDIDASAAAIILQRYIDNSYYK